MQASWSELIILDEVCVEAAPQFTPPRTLLSREEIGFVEHPHSRRSIECILAELSVLPTLTCLAILLKKCHLDMKLPPPQ